MENNIPAFPHRRPSKPPKPPTKMSTKTSSLTPHQLGVRRLLDMLQLSVTNRHAVEIASCGETTAEIAAAIRAEWPEFSDVPAVLGTSSGGLLVQRHGSSLTDIGSALLAFFAETEARPENITYTGIAAKYAPQNTGGIPAGFSQWLATRGLKLEAERGGKWWRVLSENKVAAQFA